MEYVENASPCRDCGETFMRPVRKGRAPTRCPECQARRVAEREMPVSDERVEELYSGPAAKLLGDRRDLPRGREAQCIGCWRIFTSDSCCESHKRYGHNGRISQPCKDPATVGMEPRERRGLPVWTRPEEPGRTEERRAKQDMAETGKRGP